MQKLDCIGDKWFAKYKGAVVDADPTSLKKQNNQVFAVLVEWGEKIYFGLLFSNNLV